jgi:hypothetical protein
VYLQPQSCAKSFAKIVTSFNKPKTRVNYATILSRIICEKMRIDELQNPKTRVTHDTVLCEIIFAKIVRIDEFEKPENPRYAKIL